MHGLRRLVSPIIRARGMMIPQMVTQKRYMENTKPFDNMPFNVSNRYLATVVWCFMFGIGLWAPFIIVWFQMAKSSL